VEHYFDDNAFLYNKNKDAIIEKLSVYSEMIYSENKKYNLTGFKSVKDIDENLIVKSIFPVKDLSVPRGTSGVDVGTGSGIPGIVLSVFFQEVNFTLIDANKKKTDFLEMVKSRLKLENVTIFNERIEDVAGSAEYREKYDFCITRAFGPLYYSFEFGLPLLKKEAFLYIYSHLKAEELSVQLKEHIVNLGGSLKESSEKRAFLGIKDEGLLVVKKESSPEKYPRRFPVVKRESAKCPEVE
jgi:16S rRNA (guanine527-N7)-methyltransferase